ncbi:MAG: type 4b pilus protein PilO2, partial [Myxococcales bacterium]|nr:type 4b pilus protein PilO2 [Myxococcales bacterium]
MGRLSGLLGGLQRRDKAPAPPVQPDGALPDAPALDLQYDGTGNVLCGRKRYAVGLDWEPAQPDEPVRVQAGRNRKGGHRRNLHVPFGAQIGFASQDRQQKRGSAALVTAGRSDLLGPRWAGAFRINEADRFWWVAAIRDGEVFEDAVVPDEVSARTLLLDMLDAPDWTRLMAPEDWQVSGTVPARIEQVFSLRGGAPLRPVDGRRDTVQRVVILSLIGTLAAGGYLFWSDLKRQEAEREAELAQMRDAMVRVDPRSHPWASAPPITGFVETCVQEIERTLFVLPGWLNGPITCTASGERGVVSTEWGRNGGRVTWLHAATAHLSDRVTLAEGGDRAYLRREVSFSLPDGEIPLPWEAEAVSDLVLSRFQSLGLDLTLRPRVRSLTTTQRTELRAPVYNRHDLSIETSVAIGEYARLLSDVPALVPEALIYGVESGTWTLTAKIYHPPILPLPPM